MNFTENPSVVVKRKNIQTIIDYSLDNKVEIKITPRSLPDEWDIEFTITDVIKAIELGMFLRDAKIDLSGSIPAPILPSKQAKEKKKGEKSNVANSPVVMDETTSAPEVEHDLEENEEVNEVAMEDRSPKTNGKVEIPNPFSIQPEDGLF